MYAIPNSVMRIRPRANKETQKYRVVYALIVINKAGGLIYQRDFAEGLNKLSINDYLVLAGTFHGYIKLHAPPSPLCLSRHPANQFNLPPRIHAISTRLNPLHPHSPRSSTAPLTRPEPPSGIEVLETENFRLQCFSTLTGTKFLLFAEPQQPNTDKILGKIYELYADYVMKNPFYSLEMPIRSEGWERRLIREMRGINSR